MGSKEVEKQCVEIGQRFRILGIEVLKRVRVWRMEKR